MREMKDSGIEWIGEIPKSWTITILSALFSERKCKNSGLTENNLLSLSYGNIVRKNIESNEGLLPASFETYNIIEPGNIVFRLTDLQNDKRSLRTGLCQERGIITSAYVTLQIRSNDSPRYMHYLFHTYDLCKVFYGMGDGVRQGMNYEDLKRLRILRPDQETQRRIADCLDRKCSQIDAIIAQQQEVIEKLKAYKLSVITEAVTKGLNPGVPMKDSGVEWIREIPGSWTCIRLKYLLTIKSGDPVSSEINEESGLFPVYGGGEKIGYCSEFNTSKSSILVGRVGARCGCVTMPTGLAWATDNALIIDTEIQREYMYYILTACNLHRLNSSNAQPLITAAKIKETIIPLCPNIEEQHKIVDHLSTICVTIEDSIKGKQLLVDKLNAYKKSLIYEVVTGKKV